MVYPLIELTRGHIKSESVFCQVSGFFLSLGTEACDISIVFIAIHTAMFIVLGGGDHGLYSYRHLIYAVYIIFPLTLAGLAFVKEPAYVNTGEFCYLPMRSGWSREALSWIPRYVVFGSIISLHALVYIYVSFAVARYRDMANDRMIPSSDGHIDFRQRRSSVPVMPKLSYHGLLPPTPSGSRRSSRSRRDSLPISTRPDKLAAEKKGSESSLQMRQSNRPRPEQVIRWKSPDFTSDSAHLRNTAGNGSLTIDTALAVPQTSGASGIMSTSDGHVPPVSPWEQDVIYQELASAAASTTPTCMQSFWDKVLLVRTAQRPQLKSVSNLLGMLRSGPQSPHADSPPIMLLTPRTLHATGMQQTREEIRRQARNLFLYPLVYMIVWLMPFVAHISRLRGHHAPFAIDLLSMISLCIQGAADALVFSLRERPWQVSEEDGLSRPIPWWKGRKSRACKLPHPGRTVDERLRDARMARRRLDEEIAEKRMQLLARRSLTMNWWDVPGAARMMAREDRQEEEDDDELM